MLEATAPLGYHSVDSTLWSRPGRGPVCWTIWRANPPEWGAQHLPQGGGVGALLLGEEAMAEEQGDVMLSLPGPGQGSARGRPTVGRLPNTWAPERGESRTVTGHKTGRTRWTWAWGLACHAAWVRRCLLFAHDLVTVLIMAYVFLCLYRWSIKVLINLCTPLVFHVRWHIGGKQDASKSWNLS